MAKKITELKQTRKVEMLVVIIKDSFGKCYQVSLTRQEEDTVFNAIVIMHRGLVKAHQTELALDLQRNNDKKQKRS